MDRMNPVLPQKLSGLKTEDGLRLTSRQEDNRFSLEITGSPITPLSERRLHWRIGAREVELLSIPPEDGPAPANRLQDYQQADRAALTQAGWALTGEGGFMSPSGAPCLFWSAHKDGPLPERAVVSTMNGPYVLALVGLADGDAGGESLEDYLRSTLSGLQRGDGGETAAAEAFPSEQEVAQVQGQPLGQVLGMIAAIGGEAAGAILNKGLMTPEDSRLPRTAWLDGGEMLAVLRFWMEQEWKFFSAQIFDGRFSHMINVDGFDPVRGIVTYWDPWGEGSFLQAANNEAGVAADPHPERPRFWLITAEEFTRVVYAMIQPEARLAQTFRWLLGKPRTGYETQGNLGKPLESLLQTELFSFFQLERVGAVSPTPAAPDQGVTEFKPSGPAFRALVTLRLTAAPGVVSAELVVARAFIDDPHNGVFAADLVKSFLRSFIPQADAPAVADLGEAIEGDAGKVAIVLKFPGAGLADDSLRAYTVYAGPEQRHAQTLSHCRLRLENDGAAETPSLHITVEAMPHVLTGDAPAAAGETDPRGEQAAQRSP